MNLNQDDSMKASGNKSDLKENVLQLFAYGLTVRGIFVDGERRFELRHKPGLGDLKRTREPLRRRNRPKPATNAS